MSTDHLSICPVGHVVIIDRDTGELVLDKKNAIHPQNMARAVARAMAQEANGAVFTLCLGNGGTFSNASNQLVYKTPNVIGTNAALYNQTYFEQVAEGAAGTPPGNSVVATTSPAPATSSMVIVTCELDASEPAGQAASDGSTSNQNAPYLFDELGLKTQDGLLLTHMTFSPIEKTANRAFLIVYKIIVSAS